MWIFGYGSLVWKVDFPYVKKVIGYIKGYERKFWQASIDHRGVPEKPGRVVTLVPSDNLEAKVWGAAYKIHRADIDRVMQHLDHREIMGYEKVPIDFYPISNHPQNILEPASPIDYNHTISNENGSKKKTPNEISNGTQGSTTTKTTDDLNGTKDKIDTSNGISTKNKPQDYQHNESSFSASAESDNDSNSEDIMQGRPFTVTMYYGSSENEHYIGPASLDEMARQIFESVGPSGKNKEYLYNLVKAMKQISENALDPHLAELEMAVRNLEGEFNIRSPATPMEL